MEASFRKASDAVAALFRGRPDGVDEAHTLEPPDQALPRDWPEKLPFRKRPKPHSRSISWAPLGQDGRGADKHYELFVSQSVLSDVRNHLITAVTGEPFGFLIGQVAYCPWDEMPYVVIDSVRRETQNLPPANEFDRFRHAWVAASRDARHRRGDVLGWYHRHGVLGLRLSEWDLHLQEEFFPEPWHCALVVASSSRGIIGGFIQRSRRARLFRKGLAPFNELVELDSKSVDGLRPSVVDWQNYQAGEAVSVIRAKWPTPSAIKERWVTEAHGKGVDLPTRGESITEQPRRRSSFGGRSWRPAPPAVRRPPEQTADGAAPGAADGAVTEDDFFEALRADEEPTVFESEVRLDEAEASEATPARTKKGRDQGKGKKVEREAAEAPDPATDDDSARDDPVGVDVEQDGEAWYSADFAEAIWGPQPFEAEADEASVPRDDEETEGSADEEATDEADAEVPTTATGTRPRFELVPGFEPEPPETDPPSSLEWLLDLIGDSLTRSRTDDEEDAAADEAEPADEVEATANAEVEADEESTPAEAEAADESDIEVPDDHAEAEPADEVSDPTTGDEVPPEAARPARGGRARVTPTYDPRSFDEPAIPVVVLEESTRWRPSRKQQRTGIGLVAAALLVLIVRTLFFSDTPAPPRDGTPPGGSPVTGSAPPLEFVTLTDTFLTNLQGFRQTLVEFRLGQTDCPGLGSGLSGLATAHATLSSYVSARPELSERFDRISGDFASAVDQFTLSECELPADLAGQPPSPESTSDS